METNNQELVNRLNQLLREGEVNFTYTKTNGETRQARGTKKMDLIPDEDYPIGRDVFCDWCTTYYDLDKQGWRRLQNKNLISIDSEE